MGVIYLLRNKANGKCYIGQTKRTLEKRLYYHFYDKDNRCPAIKQAIQKYGKENFVVEILEICSKENLNTRECHWIATLNTFSPNGYNLTTGGQNYRLLDDARKKKSRKTGKYHHWYGKKHTPETRAKMSKVHSGKNNAMYGKSQSVDARRKMSETHKIRKRRPHSAETKIKMSEAKKGKTPWNKGKKHSPETVEKIRKSKQNLPRETRQKMSESAKKRWEKQRCNPLQLTLFD